MKNLKLLFMYSMTFLLVQCAPENEVAESLDSNAIDEITLAKIEKMGFDIHNFPVYKDGEFFTVEGDINVPSSYLDGVNLNNNTPRTEQRRFPNIVSCAEIRYITVYNNLPSGSARNAVSLAMSHWNAISKCDIFFANTGSINNAEIIISNGSLPGGFSGLASFPSGGKPGRYIRIDLDGNPSFGYAEWRSTIEHELGHCIGFAHTNGNSSQEIFIPGSASSDGNSLMNSGRSGSVRSLSGDDKRAARLLYNLNFADKLCN